MAENKRPPGGETEETVTLTVLEANIDDLPPEILATLPDLLIKEGALDAWLTPIIMKKGRPAHMLSALCRPGTEPAVEKAIFANSSTLGVRRYQVTRSAAARRWRTVTTPYGEVRVKIASLMGQDINVSPEFEDCRALSEKTGAPIKEIHRAALAASMEVND